MKKFALVAAAVALLWGAASRFDSVVHAAPSRTTFIGASAQSVTSRPAAFTPVANAAAQVAETDPLYKTILALDTKLFTAYNTCDLTTMGAMVADDLEFYHDVTGLSVGRQSMIDAVKNNICGKVTRELVAGSLEVYPLANYGAVEIGVHRFHHPGDPSNVGEAKFIHVWHNDNGTWKITRVISFDHHGAK